MNHGRRRGLAALVAASLVLGGCTGIPDSSTPATIGPVRVGNSGNASAQPPPNIGARDLVTQFLDSNATPPSERKATTAFLTPAARNQWSDDQVTIISNRQVSSFVAKANSPTTGTVTVTGQVVGKINAAGIYSPAQPGAGPTTCPKQSPTNCFTFGLSQDAEHQYRITSLTSGLLITESQFQENYQQHVVYFYDLAHHYLVPDLRWSVVPTTDSDELGRVLVSELKAGPRPGLLDAVSTDTFPTQPGTLSVQVRGATMQVEIPGSSQLPPDVRLRLATQLAYSLQDVLSGDQVQITDGGVPVPIPGAIGAVFSASSFPEVGGPVQPQPQLYYVRYGKVITQDGQPIAGPLGDGTDSVNTIAVAEGSTTGSLSFAATSGSGTAQQLWVGTRSAGLTQTSIRGALTRPCWAPGLSEVWIGVGSVLHRITVTSGKATDSVVRILSPTPGGGQITSVRLSPDGSAVALVIGNSAGAAGQLYVGSIARQSKSVSVADIVPISPNGIVVLDAAWSNAQKLVAVGYEQSTGDGNVYETGVDGSFWTPTGLSNLPPTGAKYITASNLGEPWAEADGDVWHESGRTWFSPSSTGSAAGTAPVYAA